MALSDCSALARDPRTRVYQNILLPELGLEGSSGRSQKVLKCWYEFMRWVCKNV